MSWWIATTSICRSEHGIEQESARHPVRPLRASGAGLSRARPAAPGISRTTGWWRQLRPLIDGGRIKLYCVDSLDAQTWSDRALPIEERARRHGVYARWLTDQLVPFVHADSSPEVELITTGCSMGAYHAVQFTLQRADLAPVAIGLSGNYDVSSWNSWGERGEATYFANPVDYVPNLHGDHLHWLRGRASILLTVGQGAWETHPTGALPSTSGSPKSAAGAGVAVRTGRVGDRCRPRLALVGQAVGPSSAAVLLT